MQLFHSARLFLFFSLLFPYLSGDAGGGMFGWNPFASFGRSRYNCSGLESYPTNCDSSNNISSKRKKIKIIHISINAEFPPAAKVQRFSGWRFFLMSWCPLISSFSWIWFGKSVQNQIVTVFLAHQMSIEFHMWVRISVPFPGRITIIEYYCIWRQ